MSAPLGKSFCAFLVCVRAFRRKCAFRLRPSLACPVDFGAVGAPDPLHFEQIETGCLGICTLPAACSHLPVTAVHPIQVSIPPWSSPFRSSSFPSLACAVDACFVAVHHNPPMPFSSPRWPQPAASQAAAARQLPPRADARTFFASLPFLFRSATLRPCARLPGGEKFMPSSPSGATRLQPSTTPPAVPWHSCQQPSHPLPTHLCPSLSLLTKQ